MQIQIHTGHNIEGHEALATHISGLVEESLSRFCDHLFLKTASKSKPRINPRTKDINY